MYLRLLGGILVSYALIIGLGGTTGADPLRIALFGWLLWTALRLRGLTRYRWWSLLAIAAVLVATTTAIILGSARVEAAAVGACTLAMISVMVLTIISSVIRAGDPVDVDTVLGVLCVYLLLALLFAALNQVLAAVGHNYLHGAPDPPTASDLLYFSVVTMATVGYGDITPASEVARAVAVVEALTGQLYLVSVVAAVVGGWRGRAPQ
jgi:Ion channel